MRCEDCRDALGAYVDGELMAEEADDVREHLRSCASCTTEHAALGALSRRLRNGLERPRAPDMLRARIQSALAQPADVVEPVAPARRTLWLRLIAAGVAIAAVSSAASVALARRGATSGGVAIGEQVLSSHIRSLMPGHLTDVASNDSHNVKPWFNGRLDLSPAVPRLDSAGFPLVGGRLDYLGGRAVAVVVYLRRQHVINVFSWPANDADVGAKRVTSARGYHLVQWHQEGEEHWAASDLGLPELAQFVRLFTQSESGSAAR